jgi:pimeloyl-ACP methyl ester carboxylesterase
MKLEGMLELPGASLYYRVQGDGPPLLLMQGGAGGAEGPDAVVALLAERYTVLTYDRRGLSRSVLDAGAAAPDIATHVDDVHRLLAALSTQPASVAGFSMGALLALELAAAHPDQVNVVVAHEPPLPQALADADRERAHAEQAAVEDAFRSEGVPGAMRRFLALTKTDFSDLEPGVELTRPAGERAAQYARDFGFFMTHDAPAVRRHAMHEAALDTLGRGGAPRVVIGAGETDRAAWIYQCARRLAERLSVPLVEFPGGHNGFVTHPRAFAARLLEVLGG